HGLREVPERERPRERVRALQVLALRLEGRREHEEDGIERDDRRGQQHGLPRARGGRETASQRISSPRARARVTNRSVIETSVTPSSTTATADAIPGSELRSPWL